MVIFVVVWILKSVILTLKIALFELFTGLESEINFDFYYFHIFKYLGISSPAALRN